MEEQNIFTDNQPVGSQAETETPVASTQTFTSSQAYTSAYSNTPVRPTYSPVEKKKNTPVVFKILLAAVIGLCFGVCASIGIYAVNEITGKNIISFDNSTEIAQLEEKINDLQKQVGTQAVIANSSDLVSGSSAVKYGDAMDVTAVVDKVMPSMVSVINTAEEKYSYWGRTYSEEQQYSGSGIIIGENDDELLLVTNFHVVENNIALSVQFNDESEAEAYVKGFDSSVDIAVIAVKKEDLSESTKKAITIATLGDSDSLKIGEPAIAIGNALGYGQSVTTGVISALNRDINMENSSNQLIQTSAAINPGNSGGALLNIEGKVVGINSSKIASAQIEGMGYAIPISQVRDIIEELSNRETRFKVSEDEKGYIGIQGATVDSQASQTYGMPVGVLITKIYDNSAAAKAGLNYGDVIVKVDGQSISTIEMLQDTLNYYKGGDTVKVTVSRSTTTGYEEMDFEVTLGVKSELVD